MGTEGDPPVSNGPPPEPPPANRPTDGSIAVTGASDTALVTAAPRGADAPEENSTQTVAGAQARQAAGQQPAPGAPPPALEPNGAPDDPTQVTLKSADVFQDTDEGGTDPNPPVSRRFQEDGDAEMEGSRDLPVKKPFRSDLQTQARNVKRDDQDGWKTVTHQRRPARDGRRAPPARHQTRSNGPAHSGARPQTTPKVMGRNPAPANVWSTQGTAQLRATLRGTDNLPAYRAAGEQNQATDPALAVYYDCATWAANLRFDGDQRAMTKLEQATLFKWMHREIHLPGPPRFLTETHTSAEQDVFADYDRNHMGYRLYGLLPAGVTLSEGNAKYQFCNTALLANREGPTRAALESMLLEAQVITSAPKSKIVVLRYVWPEQRDKWRGLTFKMGAGTVTMQATDSLTTDVPRVGMDDNARALLYQLHARGHSTISHAVVRAAFAAAAKMDVFDVQSVESSGLADFSPHKWAITYAQITCPPALAHVRRIEVTHGADSLVFDIQHPRASHRAPCSKCLSIRHVSAACNSKQVKQSLQRHTLKVKVEPVQPLPKLTAALSPPSLKQQLRQLRQLAAPDLEARLRQEKKEKKAEHKKQVAVAAAQVARDAAREARLVAAAKRHEEEDRARHQLRRAQQAQREVTQQLAALQRAAQRTAAQGPTRSRPGSLEEDGSRLSSSSSDSGDSDRHDQLTAESQASPATGHSSGQDTECSPPDEESGGSAAPTVTCEPTDLANADGKSDSSVVSTHDTPDAPAHGDGAVEAHAVDNAIPAHEKHEMLALTASAQEGEQGEENPPSQENVMTVLTATSAPTTPDAPHDENAADRTVAGSLVTTQPSEASSHAKSAAPAPLGLGPGPLVTGKRAAPPSPSSSDDETHRQAKWSQGPLSPPFSADISPIAGAEEVSLALASAEDRPGATRSGRRQLPPTAGEAHELAGPADQRTKRRQQALSEFYAPESLSEAQARLEREIAARQSRAPAQLAEQFPSPALDARLLVLCSPSQLVAWQKAFGAKIIKVPGNGGCLYYALYCCRTGWKLIGTNITVASTHSVEANHYKAGVCKEYQAYLDQMLSDGTITISDLTQRYFNAQRGGFNKQARKKTIAAIRQFIDGIAGANLGGKGLERSQWAGDAELFATVWYIREPLFIISVDAQGLTSVRVIWLDRTMSDGPERIVQFFPEAGEAYEIIRTFLRRRVLPTIIVHTTLARDAGHYDSFRFPDDFYKAWTKDDPTGKAMRARMDPALASLGWYVAPAKADGIPKTVIVTVDSSGSVYEPSHPSQLSPPDFQLSPDAPLSPPAHFGLLSALNPRGRRRGRMAQLWAQAERLNLQAYREWDDAQPCDETRSEPDTVESGCAFWSASIPQLVALLRALPYPEVAVSLLKPELVIRMGNELNDLGSDRSVPEFVRAEDPVEARRQWARLVALVVVVGSDDLSDLRSVDWLRHHPAETTAALHDLRLYNWTVVSTLVNEISSVSTLPIRSAADALRSGDRL